MEDCTDSFEADAYHGWPGLSIYVIHYKIENISVCVQILDF